MPQVAINICDALTAAPVSMERPYHLVSLGGGHYVRAIPLSAGGVKLIPDGDGDAGVTRGWTREGQCRAVNALDSLGLRVRMVDGYWLVGTLALH